MLGKAPWADLAFGKVTLATATMVLAVAGLVGGETRPWPWIIGSAGFVVLHTAVNAARDRNIVRRLGREYDRVQRRAVQVVSDLGQIAGNQFGLWMVDLYLCESNWSLSMRPPFILRQRVLSRQLSVSLIEARHPPPSTDLQSGVHGLCYREAKPLLWANEAVYGETPDNAWTAMEPLTNDDLSESYGVLNVSPLIDQVGRECIGVLAIHVEPEREIIHKALGTLRTPEGRHRIKNACVELHGLLVR